MVLTFFEHAKHKAAHSSKINRTVNRLTSNGAGASCASHEFPIHKTCNSTNCCTGYVKPVIDHPVFHILKLWQNFMSRAFVFSIKHSLRRTLYVLLLSTKMNRYSPVYGSEIFLSTYSILENVTVQLVPVGDCARKPTSNSGLASNCR